MCTKCSGFAESLRLTTPREYVDLVRQLDELVASGRFRIVKGTVALQDLLQGKPWPDDTITHIFECTQCAQQFRLAAETYHGSGATWEMLSKEEISRTQ